MKQLFFFQIVKIMAIQMSKILEGLNLRFMYIQKNSTQIDYSSNMDSAEVLLIQLAELAKGEERNTKVTYIGL